MNDLKVFELMVDVYTMEDIKVNEQPTKISKLIDKTLCRNDKFLKLHKRNCFKNYCFNWLYPIETDLYKKGKIYTFIIRTVDKELVEYFNKCLINEHTESLKVLTIKTKVIPQKPIEKIYSITPLIIKAQGYWKNNLTFKQFEERIISNLIKKYNDYFNVKIDENFLLYNNIVINNKKPISMPVKGVKLLGDKVTLYISNNEISQKLAYFALGVGLAEANARSAGFCNYQYL
ncbi:CRISPR-associated endoribonuclease Cas6 [Clostridium botulinum]|uniref:CRISPR-associated protein Cas6 n=1 Tax=Clostridium botulinum C/D str. DC5 TaxID=1443128 RepID=A0A0A0IHP2_CLOBO|nr:CRISPR-associated endoribonuclease Cas6 [Clostridium botulinum]KGN00109.1 CRISPR-associated protein Cas6 [Clostridium botulinum C/D str. DC5]KOC53811.1 CRISPR-associated protein Cas6 [Clostridium botulinum]KOC57132.1 CRISPR-associated protein Cas6 [Clostridium botulinum]MCD3234152.1 CRISPR-associated endoribonuclease Cas6 [Clostridium botulinum D/C]MCD3239989.1 CRISPR-associated endoribonuclease Cas6 [Clostridium botulinum D/C]